MEKLSNIAAIYSVSIQSEQTPEEVFDLITDLGQWWPEDIEGTASSAGTEFALTVGEGHQSKNTVTDFERGKRFAWLTTQARRNTDGFDWTGTRMIFDLAPDGNHTHITFTYDGVVPEQEAGRLREICDMTIKDMLLNYLKYGKTKQDFTVTVELNKPAPVVFNALTHDVVKWWGGKDLSGNTSQLNDEFVIHHPGAHYSKQRITELVINEKLVWLVTESELSWLRYDKQEWTGTRMIFELTSATDSTILRFTHVGLTPGKECYATCSRNGWEIVIRDYLFNYITEGKAHFDDLTA